MYSLKAKTTGNTWNNRIIAFFTYIQSSSVFLYKFSHKNWSSPNWLKSSKNINWFIFVSNSMLFFFFLHSNFFGQIWSQNLKFSKLTEIWCRCALLYDYYDFNIYFFKIRFIHIFLGKFGPKSKVLQINWNFVQECIAMCLSQF